MESDEQQALERVKALAAQIKDNHQLARIIRSAKPEMRLQVYKQIAQYVTFRPKPYFLLMYGRDRVRH